MSDQDVLSRLASQIAELRTALARSDQQISAQKTRADLAEGRLVISERSVVAEKSRANIAERQLATTTDQLNIAQANLATALADIKSGKEREAIQRSNAIGMVRSSEARAVKSDLNAHAWEQKFNELYGSAEEGIREGKVYVTNDQMEFHTLRDARIHRLAIVLSVSDDKASSILRNSKEVVDVLSIGKENKNA